MKAFGFPIPCSNCWLTDDYSYDRYMYTRWYTRYDLINIILIPTDYKQITLVLCESLRWRHDGLDSVSNHQPHDCLLNRLFRRRSQKISKLHVTGLCAGNSPVTGEFPAQMATNAENFSIWWRHHDTWIWCCYILLYKMYTGGHIQRYTLTIFYFPFTPALYLIWFKSAHHKFLC